MKTKTFCKICGKVISRNRSGECRPCKTRRNILGNCKKCGIKLTSRKNKTGLCIRCFNSETKIGVRTRTVFKPGEKNPNWKGGVSISKGRPVTYIRVDGKVKMIFLHRKIWEDANGPIPDGWTIHHINGDRMDNRLENLHAMPDKAHKNVIPLLQSKIAELEKLLKT